MHSILAHECTGCGLCIEPCPVDCIELLPIAAFEFNRDTARARSVHKQLRTQQLLEEKTQRYQQAKRIAPKTVQQNTDTKAKQDYILAASQRAQAKKNANAAPT